MELEREVVFTLLSIPVTTTVVATWAMVVGLSAGAVLAARQLRANPSLWQATLEWGVSAIHTMLDEVTGGAGKKYLPLVSTIALFVLVANLMSVLPFVEAPTAGINTPVTLACIVFGSVHYFGIRDAGLWGYLQGFAQPTFLLLPINILEHFTRTLSLAVRLCGNMLSHQIIVAILLVILPLVVPAVLKVLGLFIGMLQAYIFTVLTIVYIGGAVRAGGERQMNSAAWFYLIVTVVAGLAIGVGVLLPARGQAHAASRAMEAIARQPDEATVISRNLYIGLAMIESQALYVLIVALILLFANPLAA
jgi:F-type H+-transporting ATPase subunit a